MFALRVLWSRFLRGMEARRGLLQPEIRRSIGRARKAFTLSPISPHSRLTWLWAHRLHQIAHRTGRDALHISFLHHGGERLLGHAARLQETRELGAFAQLWNAQLDRAGAGLPDPLPVTVALGRRSGLFSP